MRKTWKYKEDSPAGIQVTDKSIQATVATADSLNGILIDESGTYIRGKMSIQAMPDEIRWGGFWVEQSAWRQMFPSTTAFPCPRLVLSPPIKGIEDMVQGVAWMMSLLV
jgi:hypothetical protein